MNQNSKIEVRVVINDQNKEQSECNKESRRLVDFDFEDGKVLTLERSSDFGKFGLQLRVVIAWIKTTTTTTSHVDKFVLN
jgi:hypothetical protein